MVKGDWLVNAGLGAPSRPAAPGVFRGLLGCFLFF